MTHLATRASLLHVHMHVLDWGDDCDPGNGVDVDVVRQGFEFAEEAEERLEGEGEALHRLLHLLQILT